MKNEMGGWMANYEELEPRFKQSLLDWMETKNPFWSLLGMEVLEMKINYLK
jgi:hypothetical protein